MTRAQKHRLACARKAMRCYAACPGVDTDRTSRFIDLFADLLHLAHSMGIDGEDCYRIGSGHFRFEVEENKTA